MFLHDPLLEPAEYRPRTVIVHVYLRVYCNSPNSNLQFLMPAELFAVFQFKIICCKLMVFSTQFELKEAFIMVKLVKLIAADLYPLPSQQQAGSLLQHTCVHFYLEQMEDTFSCLNPRSLVPDVNVTYFIAFCIPD